LLWNSTEAFENVFNDSELGNGIPWWHIQDIAVIMCIFLGKYNIHWGVSDLIIPHYEYINTILYHLNKKIHLQIYGYI
jgi:cysteinyl-tRNA synthetase